MSLTLMFMAPNFVCAFPGEDALAPDNAAKSSSRVNGVNIVTSPSRLRFIYVMDPSTLAIHQHQLMLPALDTQAHGQQANCAAVLSQATQHPDVGRTAGNLASSRVYMCHECKQVTCRSGGMCATAARI